MCMANNAVHHQCVTVPRARLMGARPSQVKKKRGYCYDDPGEKEIQTKKVVRTNKKKREAGGHLQYASRRTRSRIFEELRSAAFHRDSPAKNGAEKHLSLQQQDPIKDREEREMK